MARDDGIAEAKSVVTGVSNPVTEALCERLSGRYRKPLISYFLRRIGDKSEAEDLTQEVFVRVIRKTDLSNLENPDGFIFQTAANLLKDRARRARTRDIYRYEVEEMQSRVEEFTPERVMQGKQELSSVLNALGGLTEKTRDMFVLHKLEGLKHREIADLYGVTVSAVEKHCVKALAHLMKHIEK